jgi:hypothetical protein
MLVFDADAPPTRPVRAGRPASRGRRRGSSRGIGIAVAALIILTAGVAAGSFFEPPVSDPSVDPAAADCVPTDLDEAPAFSLGIEASPLRIAGQVGYTRLPSGGQGDEGTWKVPDPAEPGRAPDIGPGEGLTIRVDGERCIRYLVAERAPAAVKDPVAADIRPLVDTAVSPSSPRPTLGSLAEGDWVVRVTAYFETGLGGAEGLVIGQRFFRVRVGEGPFPTARPRPTPDPDPTPAATPTVACGVAPTDPAALRVDLLSPGSNATAGAPEGAQLPIVHASSGQDLEIGTAGDACALSWTISTFETESGDPVAVDAVLNPADDPGFASANRWAIDVPVGSHDVVAALHLGPGLDVVRFWRVVREEFVVPDVVLTGEDGVTAKAIPGCGLTVNLANGYSRNEECGLIVLPDVIPELHVPAWSRVALEVPGWSLKTWNAICGHLAPDGAGGNYFEWECSLGGFYGESGSPPPNPARFLARPGSELIQIHVEATSEKGTFNVVLFVRIVGE